MRPRPLVLDPALSPWQVTLLWGSGWALSEEMGVEPASPKLNVCVPLVPSPNAVLMNFMNYPCGQQMGNLIFLSQIFYLRRRSWAESEVCSAGTILPRGNEQRQA